MISTEQLDEVPIDDAVSWASTARGGKQLLLLDTEPAGCVRWGLCEAIPDDETGVKP